MADVVSEFIKAACVPRDASHSSGTLAEAEAIRAAHPEIAGINIHTAAIVGDDQAVRRFINADKDTATAPGGPYNWDPLTHLCFSRYLRLEPVRSAGFVRAATALLQAGASANTGFYEQEHQPEPEFESVLYGAAGIAHQPELTRLLLDHGADPNDGEVTYHTPESDDNRALKEIVSSGRLNAGSLSTMLLRKADWHDGEGIKFLLEHGADPNAITHWGFTALHQSVQRDNSAAIVELILDHGADPMLVAQKLRAHDQKPKSAIQRAARRGRGDLLLLFARRGFASNLEGLEKLIAACALDESDQVRSILTAAPQLREELRAEGGMLLAEFAGNGNTGGVRQLLDLGVEVDSVYPGDGYFGIAPDSTALVVAAWRAHPDTVRLLIERGAAVNRPDGKGKTALQLAVRACVESYWTYRRSPDSVRALLAAGATVNGVQYPSGYAEVDELLKAHGATG